MPRKSTVGSGQAPELEALGVWVSVMGIAAVAAAIGAGLYRFIEMAM